MTFEKLGGATRTLGEFTPVSLSGKGKFSSTSFTMTFYDNLGFQRKVKDDTKLKSMFKGIEDDVTQKDMPVIVAYKPGNGWFLQTDYTAMNYPLDSYVINDGDGFQLYCNGSTFAQGVALTCSGEVVNGTTPITVPSGVNAFTGNITVKGCTLGQLTPVSLSGKGKFSSTSFTMTFYDNLGFQRKVKDDAQLKSMFKGIEEDPLQKDMPVIVAYKPGNGWFLQTDYTSMNYPLNTYMLESTDGFQLYCNGSTFAQGVQINLPSALAPFVEE